MRRNLLLASSLAAIAAISAPIAHQSFAREVKSVEEIPGFGSGDYHVPSSVPKLTILAPKSGSTKSISGSLLISNKSGRSVTLSLYKVIGLSNSGLPRRISLAVGQSKKISFRGALNSSDGGRAIGVIYNSSGGGQAVALQPIEIKNGQYRLVSTGSFDSEAPTGAVSGGVRVSRGPQGYTLRLKGSKALPATSASMKGGGGSSSRPSVNLKKPSGSGRLINFDWDQIKNSSGIALDYIQSIPSFVVRSLFELTSSPAVAASGTYKGRFVFRSITDDSVVLPASGVEVKAVLANQRCKTSSPLAATYADGDGNFSFAINASGPYKICYITANNMFRIGSALSGSNDRYIWADRSRSDVPSGRVTRRPIRHDGVFDLWHEGAFLQTSMTNVGVDPSTSSPAPVKFPSAVGDCSGSSTQPWSCAGGGRVYIAPEHAARRGTIAHELAHRVDQKYRGWTEGSGGDHDYRNTCYPSSRDGMILTEGFANYEAARALGSRSAPSYASSYRPDIAGASVDNMRMESSGRNCPPALNGSESVVASTLWDFYDTNRDGSDNLWYTAPGRITYIYLNNKPRTPKALFQEVMKDCVANGNSAVCDQIFAQNNAAD